jgi:hypothetical protein
MKVKILVTELSHEELTDLLSTSLYGSSWFSAKYDKEVYKSLNNKNGDCFEEKLADMLLAGHKITIVDTMAEGESYSNKFVRLDGDCAEYEIGLNDILKTASSKTGYELLKDVLSGEGDYFTADAFLQRVVFGKEIYG